MNILSNNVVRSAALSITFGFTCLTGSAAFADCGSLPQHSALREALRQNIKPTGGPTNGGFDLNMWATVVDRDGVVCTVVFSGENRGDQWPGSRVISAQKANAANAFSLDAFALSTANLYAPTQPGGSLFGLQESNLVDTSVAYDGDSTAYGTSNDPMVGQKIGGIIVFGGGLALYDGKGGVLGALGVSGDSSCADHNVAWRVRQTLGLDKVPAGPSSQNNDAIIYDIDTGVEVASAVAEVVGLGRAGVTSRSGFGHVTCGGDEVKVGLDIGAATR